MNDIFSRFFIYVFFLFFNHSFFQLQQTKMIKIGIFFSKYVNGDVTMLI